MTPPLEIRESRRVRRARIVVAPHRPVEVVVPPGTSAAWVDRFVDSHRAWIERRRDALERLPSLGLERPGVVWLAGRPLPAPAGDHERWYRDQARRALTDTARREGQRLGLDGWKRVRIGDQRSRWGSCSARGTLSFSWRLVMAPAWVADYVVVHELCHLRQMDHSPRFWRLLDEACPGRRRAQEWLRVHGPELLAHRP
jgi:predicted metal-dependent hydrolase